MAFLNNHCIVVRCLAIYLTLAPTLTIELPLNTTVLPSIAPTPPFIFPQTEDDCNHFRTNETILQDLLAKTSNQTLEENLPPEVFPKENVTFIQGNDTVLDKFLHVETTVVPLPPVPQEFPKDNTNYKLVPSNETVIDHLLRENETVVTSIVELPPEVFPSDETKYRIVTNKTLLDFFINHEMNETTTIRPNTKSSTDTEVADLLETQSEKSKENLTRSNLELDLNHSHDHTAPVRGPVIAILIGVLVLIACFGYMVLTFWRRSVDFRFRYGNREMLVNEYDYEPQYDSRFEL